jgi:hypothetical protein
LRGTFTAQCAARFSILIGRRLWGPLHASLSSLLCPWSYPQVSASTIVTAHVITHTLSTNRIETVTGRLTHKPDGSPVRNDAALRGSIDDEVST